MNWQNRNFMHKHSTDWNFDFARLAKPRESKISELRGAFAPKRTIFWLRNLTAFELRFFYIDYTKKIQYRK
jgi:hypothetical protein